MSKRLYLATLNIKEEIKLSTTIIEGKRGSRINLTDAASNITRKKFVEESQLDKVNLVHPTSLDRYVATFDEKLFQVLVKEMMDARHSEIDEKITDYKETIKLLEKIKKENEKITKDFKIEEDEDGKKDGKKSKGTKGSGSKTGRGASKKATDKKTDTGNKDVAEKKEDKSNKGNEATPTGRGRTNGRGGSKGSGDSKDSKGKEKPTGKASEEGSVQPKGGDEDGKKSTRGRVKKEEAPKETIKKHPKFSEEELMIMKAGEISGLLKQLGGNPVRNKTKNITAILELQEQQQTL